MALGRAIGRLLRTAAGAIGITLMMSRWWIAIVLDVNL